MSTPSFAVHAEQTIETLMQRMEAQAALDDLDIDLIDGVLNLEFEDGQKIIINRQEPLQQIWLASPEGPAHFVFDSASQRWLDEKTSESLMHTLSRVLSEKLGLPITL